MDNDYNAINQNITGHICILKSNKISTCHKNTKSSRWRRFVLFNLRLQ